MKRGGIIKITPKIMGIKSNFTIILEHEFNFIALEENSSFFFRDTAQFASIKEKFITPLKHQTRFMVTNASIYDKGMKCSFIYQRQATPEQIFTLNKLEKVQADTIYCYLPKKIQEATDFCRNLIEFLKKDLFLIQ